MLMNDRRGAGQTVEHLKIEDAVMAGPGRLTPTMTWSFDANASSRRWLRRTTRAGSPSALVCRTNYCESGHEPPAANAVLALKRRQTLLIELAR
jgi:hypothetical protein